MPLLFLEFLGTSELLLIAVVALIVFGPRKLPEIGRTLGRSLAEFRRASEDFKRTWEREVELERIERDLRLEDDLVNPATARDVAGDAAAAGPEPLRDSSPGSTVEQTIARAPSGGAADATPEAEDAAPTEAGSERAREQS